MAEPGRGEARTGAGGGSVMGTPLWLTGLGPFVQNGDMPSSVRPSSSAAPSIPLDWPVASLNVRSSSIAVHSGFGIEISIWMELLGGRSGEVAVVRAMTEPGDPVLAGPHDGEGFVSRLRRECDSMLHGLFARGETVSASMERMERAAWLWRWGMGDASMRGASMMGGGNLAGDALGWVRHILAVRVEPDLRDPVREEWVRLDAAFRSGTGTGPSVAGVGRMVDLAIKIVREGGIHGRVPPVRRAVVLEALDPLGGLPPDRGGMAV